MNVIVLLPVGFCSKILSNQILSNWNTEAKFINNLINNIVISTHNQSTFAHLGDL